MTDISSTEILIKAIHERLSADVAVRMHLGAEPRLYDHIPSDPIYPYLTYGPIRSEDISADGAEIFSHTLNLHVWSRYSGRAEVLAALSCVTTALTASALTLDGAHQVLTNILYTDIFRAPDRRTLHGLLRLSITTERELETQ